MMNLKTLGDASETVLEDLREDHTDEEIAAMTKYQALDAYLEWNGIIGWTGSILTAIEAIEKAQKE